VRRKENHPLNKHTLNLFDGDFEKLQLWYPRLGAAKVIRELVRAHVKQNEERFNQTVEPLQLSFSIEDLPMEKIRE